MTQIWLFLFWSFYRALYPDKLLFKIISLFFFYKPVIWSGSRCLLGIFSINYIMLAEAWHKLRCIITRINCQFEYSVNIETHLWENICQVNKHYHGQHQSGYQYFKHKHSILSQDYQGAWYFKRWSDCRQSSTNVLMMPLNYPKISSIWH